MRLKKLFPTFNLIYKGDIVAKVATKLKFLVIKLNVLVALQSHSQSPRYTCPAEGET